MEPAGCSFNFSTINCKRQQTSPMDKVDIPHAVSLGVALNERRFGKFLSAE